MVTARILKKRILASPGLSGFKLLKQTKLSPSLLEQESGFQGRGVAVVLAAPGEVSHYKHHQSNFLYLKCYGVDGGWPGLAAMSITGDRTTQDSDLIPAQVPGNKLILGGELNCLMRFSSS